MRYGSAICLLLAAAPVFAQGDRLPPDLALVPEDGLGFVHVRVADLWRHESMNDVRDVVKKAGEKAIAALDKRFASLPSNIERLTLWVGPIQAGRRGSFVELFVVRLSRPTEAGALRKLLLPEATEKKGKRCSWFCDELGASLLIADDRTFVLGSKNEVSRIADGTTTGATPLRDAIAVAAGDRYLVAAASVSALPRDVLFDLRREVPKELQPVLDAQCATASLDLAGEGHLHVRLQYSTDAAAEKAAGLLKAPDGPARKLIADTRRDLEAMIDDKAIGLEQVPLAAAALVGLGVLRQAEDVLSSDKVRRDGSALTAAIDLPSRSKTIVVPAAFATGVKLAHLATLWRGEAHRLHTSSLSQILLGFHNYHDVNGGAPVAITNADGKALLSWRVALLPYVEEDNLFRQFKLDEPWDSEHNKKLIEKMPKIFEIEGVSAKAGHTHYRTFVGEKAMWSFDRGAVIPTGFPDGTSNTVAFVQATEPTVWTRPDELEFDGKVAVKSRLLFHESRTIVGMVDGSVKVVRETITEDVWKMLVDPADGQPLPDDVFKK